MCRGGRYSFPGLLYFTLDPYLIMLSVKQGGIKYHFLSLWYDPTWDWTQVSRPTDKMKRSFFQAAVTSILLYGCTTWTLTKRLEKKLDGNYTRMLRAILNKSWQQHPTRHQLYGHLPPITKTIQVRRTRHAGHCWRSRDELIRYVLLWIPTHGRAKAGRPARTYIQQLCEDTGCCPEDLPRAMNDREEWRERVRDIRAASTIWWWWLMKATTTAIIVVVVVVVIISLIVIGLWIVRQIIGWLTLVIGRTMIVAEEIKKLNTGKEM